MISPGAGTGGVADRPDAMGAGSALPAAIGVRDGRRLLVAAVVAFSIGAVGTILWGFVLASRRLWRELAISVVAGTVAVLAWYWGVMLADEGSGNSAADHAVAAGMVIFSIPIAVGAARCA